MRCERARDYIGAWRDGELSRIMMWRIGRHIRQCADCAAESESLARLDADLRAITPFGPEPHPMRDRRFHWQPVLGLSAAVLMGCAVFSARGRTPAIVTASSSHNVQRIAAVLTPAPIEPRIRSEKAPPATHASKSTARAAVKTTPSPIRRPSRKIQRRWPSPVYRPMPQRPLKPRIAPTPETDREVIMIAARPLTDEEILAQCGANEEVIEICAEMLLPEIPAPTPTDNPMPMQENNP